jgi:zinc/manganese transport system substrate-binding protein
MKSARAVIAAAGALILASNAAACSMPGGTTHDPGVPLVVVAAENTWGSIAAQLGGVHVVVTSIVSDPNADPHEYESNPADARLMASANYVIVNGAGYDNWANHLLAAQASAGRKVLNVANLVGKRDGDNPHFWYDPSDVYKVIAQITADYRALQPAQSSYFSSRSATFAQLLAPYKERLAYVQQHFAGTAVASTESILQYLAEYVHLDVVTPVAFMQAVAEGNDPPASSLVTFTDQIRTKAFRVLVFNLQTVTPLTTQLKEQAASRNIPVVGVSETIQPPVASFEEWMVGQLDSLINALNSGALGK